MPVTSLRTHLPYSELGLYTLFQPFVDVAARKVVAYEALTHTASAVSVGCVLERCTPHESQLLDLHCRTLALSSSAGAGLDSSLSLNLTSSPP